MTKLRFTVAALVFAAAACGTSAETERKLAELEQANTQKDSLMQEVAISSRLISDVNAELAKASRRILGIEEDRHPSRLEDAE